MASMLPIVLCFGSWGLAGLFIFTVLWASLALAKQHDTDRGFDL